MDPDKKRRRNGGNPPFVALLMWGMVLREPLLTLRRRARLESQLAKFHRDDPQAAELFFAGLLSDLILTFPAGDVWRNLRFHYGEMRFRCRDGDQIPLNKVLTPNSIVFGTLADEMDLVTPKNLSPYEDPQLVGLAGDDLTLEAAVILAAAAGGYLACLRAIREVRRVAVAPDSELRDLFPTMSSPEMAAGHVVRDAMVQACRWLLHRRRGYTGLDDRWFEEAVARWAWRAANPKAWTDEEVAQAIVPARINQVPPSLWNRDDEQIL